MYMLVTGYDIMV